jgi:hypothetical protein
MAAVHLWPGKETKQMLFNSVVLVGTTTYYILMKVHSRCKGFVSVYN